MKNFFLTCITILVLLTTVVQMVHAQSKTGTTIGQSLLIEPSARIAAMGNAGVAVSSEALSFYYNPAALGHINTSDAQFTHSNWLAGITYDYFSTSLHIGSNNSLGLSLMSLNSGEIAVRTVEAEQGTGERYSVSDFAIGLGYGQRITDRFSAGFQLTFFQQTIWHASLNVFAVNFGTLYQITDDGLQLGASISNFGTRGKYSGRDLRIRYDIDPTRNGDNGSLPAEINTDEFTLPIVFRVGMTYPLKINEDNEFHFVVDAFHPSDNSESMSVGGEYLFMKSFALRGGYQQLYQKDSEVGLTFGAGFNYDVYSYMLHVDYSWAKHQHLGDMQRFTVGVTY